MCWSGEASTAIAVLGFTCTGYLIRKKESPLLWACMFYFTLMEALQAYTYSVIDKCGMPENGVATLLGYLHITFQPFFVNAFSLYFIPRHIAKRVAPYAFAACFVAAIFMLLKLYPFASIPMCTPGSRPMCGEILCSYHGSWHIAWQLPINTFMDYIPFYLIAAFIVPALYGSWKFTLFHLITGPMLARLTTSDLNEWPAVWCLFSLEVMLIALSSRLRDRMHVTSWIFWRKSGPSQSPANLL